METAVDSIDNKSTAARYAFAVLTAVLALVLRQTLSPLLGANNPYFTVWAAVVFSAWYYGVGPSVVTTLMSALGVWYWFLLPLHSFRLQDSKMQIGGLVGFGVLSGFIIALGEANRRSHRKRLLAEQSVREKECEYHLLADSIPELCWMARGDGHIFWYNARWYEYTGTTPGQMEGWGWQSVHDPEILPSVLERWKASLADGQPFEMEFPLLRADGVFRWFLTRIRPVRNSEGNIVRWFGTNTNIHEQRELRQSLIEARQELEIRVSERTAELEQKTSELSEKAALLDLVNDAIFVRCAEDKISYWNQGAERLYGWTSAEVLGRLAGEVLRTEFPVPLEQIKSLDKWEGELRHIKRDGSQIVVASRWTTLRDNEGKPAGWLEINSDVTARKRAEDAARGLSGRILSLQDEERRRIARGLHDSLGQYLTALKMNLNLLSSTEAKQAAVASECSEIVDKCLTETRTVSHLLHPPLLDEVGLKSALQWYLEGFAQRSDIQVILDLPTEFDRLDRDVETTLFRVVQEALTNVHRHSHASKVAIRLLVANKQVLLGVSDNGRGIPTDQLQGVLQSGSGTGVGLAGMRERVRDLGGSLEIKSDHAGTAINTSIPLTEKASADLQELGESVGSISAA
ncbi:MAG: PAS domain S-box protein [Candidatus Korobacteraceae bacterium]